MDSSTNLLNWIYVGSSPTWYTLLWNHHLIGRIRDFRSWYTYCNGKPVKGICQIDQID